MWTYFNCSDKTDVESTHSSNVSAFRGNPQGAEKVVIPPDALYATSTKKIAKQNTVAGNAFVDSSSSNQQMNGRNNHIHQQQLQHSPYIYEPMFNDSKVRIHTFSRRHLNAANAAANSLHHQQQQLAQQAATAATMHRLGNSCYHNSASSSSSSSQFQSTSFN